MAPSDELAPVAHGGDPGAARALFPGALEPFLDLSTGINPHPYKVPQLAADLLTELPQKAALAGLAGIAAQAYGAPSATHVAAAPGSQILMTLIASLSPPGSAAILGPTYAEHARALRLAGHGVQEVSDLAKLEGADLAVVVNPNNPDGRLVARDRLVAVAERVGLLVVDEAFMEAVESPDCLASDVERGNIVVLRSFGKFFGLPGLRLGFALASPPMAARLGAALGPWPLSGIALSIGSQALADKEWIETARASLAQAVRRLDTLLVEARLEIVGGTSLFRLIRTPDAPPLFQHLGRAGIFVRRFAEEPAWLRFGLPGSEKDWQRLGAALATFRQSR